MFRNGMPGIKAKDVAKCCLATVITLECGGKVKMMINRGKRNKSQRGTTSSAINLSWIYPALNPDLCDHTPTCNCQF
jgi:hypothetical protein